MIDFEKLGVFYLGRRFDPETKATTAEPVLYDAKDLTTHAVCVGMTGSGKTGLCLGLIEEAALDGIPSLIIDPKGDLANLMLTFPGLRPEDFRPWINEDDARTKGLSPDDFAAKQAALWTKGLADWGQDGERIARLRDSAPVTIYTPGSNAGVPLSVLRSFDAPPDEVLEDTELFRGRVSSTATGLLGLLGITADPLQSREHILISSILGDAWGKGQDLDLPTLIQRIQQPPFSKLGVMELEAAYPAKDRFGLATALNNLVAAPGFGAWLEGEPVDIGAMLYTKEGKPRVAIVSIAHLSDAERMFVVAMVMNQVLAWTRAQSGTTSLRAIVYMDEIAGYFPPVANPPSKQAMLTLMKQARAFGVGMVLATQNPVDLDYKGLANAGTWFIGRLQTDRDKQRVLDGLEGAAANASSRFDRATADRLLSRLGSRVFLMNNVHEDEPVVFETRWCLSYLRGPLTRAQIKTLMAPLKAGPSPAEASRPAPAAPASPKNPGAPASPSSARPVLPPDVPQYFIPSRGSAGHYRPMLLGLAKVYFADAKSGVEAEESISLMASISSGPVPVDWEKAVPGDHTEDDVEHQPAPGHEFASLPPDAGKAKSYDAWKKSFADALFRTQKLDLLRSAALKAVSKAGESEGEFRARLAQLAREQRDAIAEKLRAKYAPKIATIQDRIRRAEQTVEVQKEQASSAKLQSAISFGSAILGAFMGRKIASTGNVGKAATALKGASRTMKESSDVSRAKENVEALTQQLKDLEAQFEQEIEAQGARFDPATEELERLSLRPKKTGISVKSVMLAWAPHDQAGSPLW